MQTSWGRAWNHCASQGWNLLSIQSIDEELEITEKLVNHGNRFYWTSGRHLGESWFWVTNATDTGIAMKKILYKNWGDDQPPVPIKHLATLFQFLSLCCWE